MADNNTMNVGFLRGTQSNLNALLAGIQSNEKTAQAGAFYITNDTDRLYFAQSATELVNLNKSIISVDTVEDLKTVDRYPGEFYYIKVGNILCYYSSDAVAGEPDVNGDGQWIQVNVDTNTDTDTIVSNIEVSDAQVKSETKTVDGTQVTTRWLEMTCTISRTDIDGTDLTPLTDNFKITEEQINSFVEKVTVNVSIGSAANSTNITLGGQGTGSVALKEGDNVSLDGSVENEITISAVDTTYGLSNVHKDETDPSTEVILKDNNGTEDAVAFEVGTDNNDLEVDCAVGKIIYSHKSYDPIEAPTAGDSDINAGKFKAITNISVTNGHVTAFEESEFSLPDDNHAVAVKVGTWTEKDAEGKDVTKGREGEITVLLNDGAALTSGQELYYLIKDANGVDQKYYNKASLTNAIKELIQSNFTSIVDAMVFRGAVANAEELSKLEPSIGDVYIVKGIIEQTAASTLEEDVSNGDIIIANGTEDAKGKITADSLNWIVVPGFEVDTTYTLVTNTDTIQLKDSTGSDSVVSTIALAGDDAVSLSTIEEEDTYTLQVEHATILNEKNERNDVTVNDEGDPLSLDYSDPLTVITGVNYNDYGHVTGVETTEFTLPAFVDQTHTLSNSGKVTELKDAHNSTTGAFSIDNEIDDKKEATGPITVTAVARTVEEDGKTKTIGTDYTVEHNKVTVTIPEVKEEDHVSTNHGDTITVVTGIEDDDYGHMKTINTTVYKLPGQDTLVCTAQDVKDDNNNVIGASITHTLKDGAGDDVSSVIDEYISENTNLTITQASVAEDKENQVKAHHEIKFNLVWGTF